MAEDRPHSVFIELEHATLENGLLLLALVISKS